LLTKIAADEDRCKGFEESLIMMESPQPAEWIILLMGLTLFFMALLRA